MVKIVIREAALAAAKLGEFDLENDDPSVLEIRQANASSGFHYFYHPGERRLITRSTG